MGVTKRCKGELGEDRERECMNFCKLSSSCQDIRKRRAHKHRRGVEGPKLTYLRPNGIRSPPPEASSSQYSVPEVGGAQNQQG